MLISFSVEIYPKCVNHKKIHLYHFNRWTSCKNFERKTKRQYLSLYRLVVHNLRTRKKGSIGLSVKWCVRKLNLYTFHDIFSHLFYIHLSLYWYVLHSKKQVEKILFWHHCFGSCTKEYEVGLSVHYSYSFINLLFTLYLQFTPEHECARFDKK